MSVIDDLRAWYGGLNEVDRYNLRIVVVGAIVLVIAIYLIVRGIDSISFLFKGSNISDIGHNIT